MIRLTILLNGTAVLAMLAGCAKTPDTTTAPVAGSVEAAQVKAEAAIPDNPMKEAYFGEQHVHTSYSLDAYIGGARLTPNDAYRFAKGETMTVNGQQHSIGRPLDWAAITDHAEYLGEMYSTQVEGAPGHDNAQLAELRGLNDFDEQEVWFLKYVQGPNRSAGKPAHAPFWAGPETNKSGWKVEIAAATANYQPGKFTTMVAFEWSGAPNGANLHRNVFFRDLNVPDEAFSYVDGNREDLLWAYMAAAEAKGSKVFAVPHNSNASKGVMFGGLDGNGKPYTAAYAKTRNHFEPLIEMMQIKGNSEVNRNFWAADEFADFENADSMQKYSGRTFAANNYVRWAEGKGLHYKTTLGTNPFQMGFVGGTDSHNGTPSDVTESNYIGSHGAADNTVEKRRTGEIGGWIMGKDTNPGALTGVWATKNTRGAIWDGMRARETFATSGPRIKVRMFAGAGLAKPADALALVRDGYKNGVPMGGVLGKLTSAPVLTVYAEKDPQGANLDRIQIVKAWADADGNPHDKVIEVVWSGNRSRGADGKVAPVGNTVDLKTAKYTNSIGAPMLIGSWTDPDFKADQNALYYARVIEIPTPRWSTYDAVRNNLPLLTDVPATVQERAWGSPVWYMP
jgi:Protein of unknown function (DUF3604)